MSAHATDKGRSEMVAAAAVANALGARLIRRDRPGAHQTRDFDLVFGDQIHEPLEVTTFASQHDIETWERLDRRGGEIPAPQLANDWHLDVGPPITASRSTALDVRLLAQQVVALLRTLEVRGHRSVDYSLIDRDPSVSSALRRLLELGVDDGRAASRREPGGARVVLVAPVGGFGHPDLVAGGIEREAEKTDNRKKLTEPPDALRRHLVVVFDWSSGPAFSAVRLGTKGRLPRLPHPITTAWALASETLLCTTPPRHWTDHRVPEQVFSSPETWLDA